MKHVLVAGLCVLTTLFTAAAAAQSPDPVAVADDPTGVARWEADRTQPLNASEVDLEAFRFIARPVLIFADSANDPQFVQQMDLLTDRAEELALRDVVMIVDTDPAAAGDVRLFARPRGFMLALVSKEGRITTRKTRPWDVRELSRSIDKMPLRQQEMQDRRLPGE